MAASILLQQPRQPDRNHRRTARADALAVTNPPPPDTAWVAVTDVEPAKRRIPQVEAGKMKVLGVASGNRAASLPKAPTIAENALPGFNIEIWFGVSAPAKTPPAFVARYAKAIEAMVALPEVEARIKMLGFELAYAGSDDFSPDHRRLAQALWRGDPESRIAAK